VRLLHTSFGREQKLIDAVKSTCVCLEKPLSRFV